jgi:hypothetical protein
MTIIKKNKFTLKLYKVCKNIINNKLEYSIGFLAFVSISVQFCIFYFEYRGNNWLSSFGDYFGFSAAFLSALVIVLLIRELKEQRESRVNLENSFEGNAETLKSVKEYFEMQQKAEKYKEISNEYAEYLKIVMYNRELVEERTIKNNFSEDSFIRFFTHYFDKNNKSFEISKLQQFFNHGHYNPETLLKSMHRFYSKILNNLKGYVDLKEIAFSLTDIEIIKSLNQIDRINLEIITKYLNSINNIISIDTIYIFLIFISIRERVEDQNYNHYKLLLFYNLELFEDTIVFTKKNENGYIVESEVMKIISKIKRTKFLDLNEKQK